MVEEPQIVFPKAHQPDFLADLGDAHRLPGEGLTEVDLSLPDADPAAAGDDDGAVVEGILQLADPADELVLEAAVNGRASAILTHNTRDFLPATHDFKIEVIPPGIMLERMRK